MSSYSVYNDIKARTNGEIYIGVVGPVRTGKSTFIKRFMELMVIPAIVDENSKKRAIDELPQSATGRLIMTTEPKFIPKDAIEVELEDGINIKVRLVDCVGYMVEGALGHEEEDKERMVKTPWFDEEIPFIKAAHIGTKKVIEEHSTIGIVVTCDETVGDIPVDNYAAAQQTTIEEMKAAGKPFVVVLNSARPYAAETIAYAKKLEKEYSVKVIPISCLNMKKTDIDNLMAEIVDEFPIDSIEFYMPKWIEMLEENHPIMNDITNKAMGILEKINTIRDAKVCLYNEGLNCDNDEEHILNIKENGLHEKEEYIEGIQLDKIDVKCGKVCISITIFEKYYYDVLSKMTGVDIDGEVALIHTLKKLASQKNEMDKLSKAYQEVKERGYGVVTPDISEITLMEPELVKHGSKYGIKLRATAPSMHMIEADIVTEIAPLVGSEAQAADLITYLQESSRINPDGIWETNIFGKSIKNLIDEGIHTKVGNMSEETRMKMGETLSKLLNDSKGGVICIII